ncbi:uracil-DNA glycosylase [Hwanghaeella sp.]|uniref:uracil-DNA glycosylase n=1 Tax=Hwanghaeella sp. TaxID=2605943 RepID=UPI003CCBB2A3
MTASFSGPDQTCALCPRLAAFRAENRAAHPDWHNGPVDSFGPLSAELLVIGLAPGLQGANKTGRPFTGDYAGDLLYQTLTAHGYTTGTYDKRRDDGLELINARITNAVRCVPPQNKPVGSEVANCLPFLAREIAAMPNLKAMLCLGQLSHNATLRGLGYKQSAFKFGHAAIHRLTETGPVLVDSYHCSRYNTNTGRLTEAMFDAVFDILDELIAAR